MKPFQKNLLMASSLATGLTGVAYFVLERFYVPVDPFAVGHPLEPWLLKAHILVAPVLVFAIGLITLDHIWRNYRCLLPAGRRSGVAAMWTIGPMVITGYLIQAVTAAGWLEALGWIHLGTGLGYLLSLLLHQRVFRGALPVTAARTGAGRPREVPGRELPSRVGRRANASPSDSAQVGGRRVFPSASRRPRSPRRGPRAPP